MSENDEHVQETWILARDGAEEITVELWTDDETVRVYGGPDDGGDSDRGRREVEEELLPKYKAAGYRITHTYRVNDPVVRDDDALEDDDSEPDGRPEHCPECEAPVVYEPSFGDEFREGAAWLCTECKWGQWLTV
ncbi:hypothetical protein ACGFNY_44260 [Streptomyces chartreusis]|uniref:hypothetical protein n=1 Tax=Streptomyces chartreusis TaxID=1969 RepID=UPI0037210730